MMKDSSTQEINKLKDYITYRTTVPKVGRYLRLARENIVDPVSF